MLHDQRQPHKTPKQQTSYDRQRHTKDANTKNNIRDRHSIIYPVLNISALVREDQDGVLGSENARIEEHITNDPCI